MPAYDLAWAIFAFDLRSCLTRMPKFLPVDPACCRKPTLSAYAVALLFSTEPAQKGPMGPGSNFLVEATSVLAVYR